MPGGRIAPDGRPAQAPGVGKNSKRHDLEAPATPGLHGSDLQQGDVQALEQAQRVAPRPKKQQPKAAPAPRDNSGRPQANGSMEVPDPIQFAAGRIGGETFASPEAHQMVDPTPWMPLLEAAANMPNSGGALSSGVVSALRQYRQRPVVSKANFIDFNELDNVIKEA